MYSKNRNDGGGKKKGEKRKKENLRSSFFPFDPHRPRRTSEEKNRSRAVYAFPSPSYPMADSAAAMRRSLTSVPRHQVASAGNTRATLAPARRRSLAKCAVAVGVGAAAAGDSARGFGGGSPAASSSSSKRAASASKVGKETESTTKQLNETRAALREALDELAAMSAKAEVNFFLILLLPLPSSWLTSSRIVCVLIEAFASQSTRANRCWFVSGARQSFQPSKTCLDWLPKRLY